MSAGALLGGDVPTEGGWLPAHLCLRDTPPGLHPSIACIATPAPGTGTRLAVHCTLIDPNVSSNRL